MRRRPLSGFPAFPIAARIACALVTLVCATCVHAQTIPDPTTALPPLRGPTLPVATPPLPQQATKVIDSLQGVVAYAERARALATIDRRRVALDPHGAAMLRHEYMAFAPDTAALSAAGDAGFRVLRREHYEVLDLVAVILHDERQRTPARAMRALQAAMPGVETTFHHLYLPATAAAAGATAIDATPAGASTASDSETMPPAPRTATSLRIGLIDGGVDGAGSRLSRARIERHGCNGAAHPQAHGTVVAERLFDGRAGTLYAADLWCGDRVGRGTVGVIDALDWMARERVPVINISLVGPDNPLLRRAIARMYARGHIVVAAVGNDGPAAPPLFPASYPDVIGVGAVDGRLRVLPESASGPQVDFCAPGVIDGQRRGTSFAAPVVARAAAIESAASTPLAIGDVLERLRASARDVGKPGRDTRCGEGFLSGI
jgi:hypothetical protein